MKRASYALIALLVLAAPTAASAQRASGKTVTTKKWSKSQNGNRAHLRPTAGQGVATKARRRSLRTRLGAKLFARRSKISATPQSRQALESRLAHKFVPYAAGTVRKWSVTMNGKPHTTMVETVARTEIKGKGEIHSEVHTSFGGSAPTSAVHVTRNGELLSPQTAKLGDKAPEGVSFYGPALPAKLKVGKSWSNIIMYEGGGASRYGEYKVTKAIRMKGPDGKMRSGFEVSVVDKSRTRSGGKLTAETTSTGVYRVLEGVGMVYSSMTTNGSTMVHQLTDFTAP